MLGLGLGINKGGIKQSESFFLDNFPGAYALFSLRQLSADWLSQPVVEVRRSSDSTLDSFTTSEVLDGTLLSFCGVGDGLVKTWYDQSGGGHNAIQNTTGNQPKIVNAGALVLEAGLPSLLFDGIGDSFTFTAQSASVYSAFTVNNFDESATYGGILKLSATIDGLVVHTTSGGYVLRESGVYKQLVASGVGGGGTKLIEFIINGTSGKGFANNIAGTPITVNGTAYTLNSICGDFAGKTFKGTMSEMIIYYSDQSSVRADIAASINEYYSLY